MSKILFVDDVKRPEWFGLPENTPRIENGFIAIDLWNDGNYDTLYLDNDLGLGIEGYDVLVKIIESGKLPKKVVCISNNIIARNRMCNLCYDFNIKFDSKGI